MKLNKYTSDEQLENMIDNEYLPGDRYFSLGQYIHYNLSKTKGRIFVTNHTWNSELTAEQKALLLIMKDRGMFLRYKYET